jgi:hypothetical protein
MLMLSRGSGVPFGNGLAGHVVQALVVEFAGGHWGDVINFYLIIIYGWVGGKFHKG